MILKLGQALLQNSNSFMLFYNIYNADFTQGFDFSLVLFLVSGYLIIFVLSYFIVPRIVHNWMMQ
jgi:hypothetical protein